uniref:Integrase catalytic domain-containing protein n=1 Tax=Stegastes partitus TaxID=144197 RepID=A0A3B5A2A5_9TELE
MSQDMKLWTKTCLQCMCAKARPEVRIASLWGIQVTSISIFVMADLFSKYALAVPTKDQSANTTARALYSSPIQTSGSPECILTDQGAAFESAVVRELCQLYGCQTIHMTAYHPQGHGACERFNQTLLRLFPALIQVNNNTTRSTTRMTPQYVVFGRHARLPVDWVAVLSPTLESYTLQDWVKLNHKVLSHTYQAVKNHYQRGQEQDQTHYNRRVKRAPLLPGERVLVRNFRKRAKGKLAPRLTPEPFVVVTPLREDNPVYVLWPEGREGPTRTVNRNKL